MTLRCMPARSPKLRQISILMPRPCLSLPFQPRLRIMTPRAHLRTWPDPTNEHFLPISQGLTITRRLQPNGLHPLELGQVGTVVLAVSQLHQAIIGDGVISTTGGGVKSDPLDGEGIDVAVGMPEIGFQGLPSGRVAEALQDQGQAVGAEFDGPDRLADEGLEGELEILGPGLDGGLAVVGAG